MFVFGKITSIGQCLGFFFYDKVNHRCSRTPQKTSASLNLILHLAVLMSYCTVTIVFVCNTVLTASTVYSVNIINIKYILMVILSVLISDF